MRHMFTGEELARAHLLHLTRDEQWEYIKKEKKGSGVLGDGFLSTLRRRLFPRKIFLIRDTSNHGMIIMADNEEDALVQVVPSISHGRHHCKDPLYNPDCSDCRAVYDEIATRLNTSTVLWLGWGQPEYNWVIHF